jgi:hypothetical protein
LPCSSRSPGSKSMIMSMRSGIFPPGSRLKLSCRSDLRLLLQSFNQSGIIFSTSPFPHGRRVLRGLNKNETLICRVGRSFIVPTKAGGLGENLVGTVKPVLTLIRATWGSPCGREPGFPLGTCGNDVSLIHDRWRTNPISGRLRFHSRYNRVPDAVASLD